MKALAGNVHFKSELFDFQLLRAMHHSRYGGPDFGECLAIAFQIEEGDRDGWRQAWSKAGDRYDALAEEALAHGKAVRARRFLLYATECHRSSAYFLLGNPEDPILHAVLDRMQSSFRRAGELMDGRMTLLSIPFEGKMLPGYLVRPEGEIVPRPTIIINSGYTSFCEESYFFGGVSALERGWNVVFYDGPGQGSTLIKQGLPFRPDWEKVIFLLLHQVAPLPGVDPDSIVVFGRSFNALLSIPGVAAIPQIRAFMADPGEYDKYRDVVRGFPQDVMAAFDRGDDGPLARFLDEKMRDPDTAFSWQCRMKAHGTATPVEYVREMKKYNFFHLLENIKCPTAIACADHDDRGTEEARAMFDQLKGEKVYLPFSAEQGAGEHCQVGAPELCHQAFYDWLEEILAKLSR